MREDNALEGSMQKIEELIGVLDGAADPMTRAAAKDLVAALMDVHGGCLARMLEQLKNTGEVGQQAIRSFQSDPLIRNILILYELHSDDLRDRVSQAIEKFRGSHAGAGIHVELLGTGDGVIRVRYSSENKGCGSGGVKAQIESILLEAAPDAAGIYVEDASPSLSNGFVPVSALLMPAPVRSESQGSANPA